MALAKGQQPVRQKKIPLRMCVGCGELRSKKDMVRVVRTPAGEILLDPTGKKSGRGAYIDPNRDCLVKAVKGKKLERALGHAVTDEVLAALEQGMVK